MLRRSPSSTLFPYTTLFRSVEDGMRLTVTCICLGVIFLEGKRCQRSEEAHASAKPAPKTRTHPSPGVVERARVPVGLLPELKNWTRPNPVFGRSPLFAASGMANTIAKAAYRKEAQPPKNATPAKIPRSFFQKVRTARTWPASAPIKPMMKNCPKSSKTRDMFLWAPDVRVASSG